MAAFAPLIATNLGVRVLPGLPWPLANDMSLSPLQSASASQNVAVWAPQIDERPEPFERVFKKIMKAPRPTGGKVASRSPRGRG